MVELNFDVLVHICTFLNSYSELATFQKVCKLWREAALYPSHKLWREIMISLEKVKAEDLNLLLNRCQNTLVSIDLSTVSSQISASILFKYELEIQYLEVNLYQFMVLLSTSAQIQKCLPSLKSLIVYETARQHYSLFQHKEFKNNIKPFLSPQIVESAFPNLQTFKKTGIKSASRLTPILWKSLSLLKHLETLVLPWNIQDAPFHIFESKNLKRINLSPDIDFPLTPLTPICSLCKLQLFPKISSYILGPPSQFHITLELFIPPKIFPRNENTKKHISEVQTRINCKNRCHGLLWLVDGPEGEIERGELAKWWALATGEGLIELLRD